MAKISPYARVSEVAVADVTWRDGFWAGRIERCRKSMIPSMWKILDDPSLSHAFANFRIAAGLEEGNHSGPPFFDGDLYKWLESVADIYAQTRDTELDRLMDDVIAVIARAQRSDGYLHTPVLIAQKNGGSAGKVDAGDRLHFEVYNFGHLMTTACRHAQATGKDSLLSVARRVADYLIERFRNPDPETAKNNICPSHLMGLVELYRQTGEAKYLDLAAALIDSRDIIKDGTDDNQDRIPFRAQRKAVGHAVRANYLYAGVADVYSENGDPSLLPPLESIWQNVAHTKTYITGATGALYDGVSPDGDEDHWAIQRIHQAYGREYQLPNATAYNETCANIGNALWNWRMFRITGEARFMDTVETVLYNSVLSGISLDGTKFFYQNALRRERALPFVLRWPRTRSRYLSSFCCPPNVLRTIAGAGAMAYGISREGITVNLYGGNDLSTRLSDGSPVALSQESDYPWDGKILVRVEEAPNRAFSLSFRIPAWAKGATLRIRGAAESSAGAEPEEKPVAGSYCELNRIWKAGDVVELKLPMNPRLVLSHHLVEETRNQAAILRGPIVYCLESADLPKSSADLPDGPAADDIYLPSDISLATVAGSGVLEGMTLLRGTVCRLAPTSAAATGSVGAAGVDTPAAPLYPELGEWSMEKLDLSFVPYFAWDNRGSGEMSVWMPLRWV